MSRPAAPESETPEPIISRVHLLLENLTYPEQGVPIDAKEWIASLKALAFKLQDELSLAQTEIKGHMRMGEELKAELAAHKIVIGLLFESLPECPFMGDLPGYVDEMKARIAELEKVLRLYQRGRHGWEEEGMLAGEWLKIQAQFDAAVTEALKDRA